MDLAVFKKSWILFLLSFLAGASAAFAMAPTSYWFLLFPALSMLYIATTQARNARMAALFGWAFSFGYFGLGMVWIGNALLVEGNEYAWAWPLCVGALPAALALFTAFGCFMARRFTNPATLSGYLGFAAFLALSEFMRGHMFTGFPWNLYGYSWISVLEIAQLASLHNIYGLTLLTILWATLPGYLLTARGSGSLAKTSLAVFMLLSFAAAFAYGSHRLSNNPTLFHEDVSIRIVQPNVDQKDKWKRDLLQPHFEEAVNLSASDGEESATTYIIWPETALNYMVMRDPFNRELLRDALQSYEGKSYLLAGTMRHDPITDDYSNSLLFFDQSAENTMAYDKSHLVPFGEYIPLQKWIPLEPVAKFRGLKRGAGPQNFTTPEGLQYSPLVCYEIIFPGNVRQKNASRPDFIVNVTNDAWYGDSAGPHQHYVQARFRAIEEGIPVIRAANTGFSGVIDSMGRNIYKTRLFETNTEDVLLPIKTNASPPFQAFANIIFLLLTGLLAITAYVRRH